MTSSAAGARWDPHPLLSLPAGPRHLEAYVKFKIWDKSASKFEDVPPGINVDLIDDTTGDPIDSVPIGTSGIAHFNIATLSPEYPDIYFLVDTGSIPTPFAGHNQLPDDWSTKGWRSSDGKEFGYKKAFAASTFGTSVTPIEFEIGVRFHITVTVQDSASLGPINLLPNTKLEFRARAPGQSTVVLQEEVGATGAWTCFSFDVDPGSAIELRMKAENDSTGKGFPFLEKVFVDRRIILNEVLLQPIQPLSFTISSSTSGLSNVSNTSIGYVDSSVKSHVIYLDRAYNKDLIAAFTFLKNLAEHNCLWHHIVTPWDNYHDAKINLGAHLLGGLSLPNRIIHLVEDFERQREKQNHEFSHQSLYRLSGLTQWDIVKEYCFGGGVMSHWWTFLYNPINALLEGWAACFELMFGAFAFSLTKTGGSYGINWIYKVSTAAGMLPQPGSFMITDKHGNPYLPGVLDGMQNWGESVEATFGGALYELFRDYVLPQGGPSPPLPLIPPAFLGDITKHAHLAWLSDPGSAGHAARERFKKVFVYPAQSLSAIAHPSTTDFIEGMRASAGNDWPVLCAKLQAFRMAFPQVEAVTPNKPSSGDNLTITGRHFIAGATVFIDGQQVIYSLDDARTISCTVPVRPPGTVADVKVVTADGDHVLKGALTYD